MIAVCWLLFVGRCWLCVVCCLLPVEFLVILLFLLFVVGCFPFDVCLLFSVFSVWCLLFAAC